MKQTSERIKQILYDKISDNSGVTYAQLIKHAHKKKVDLGTFYDALNLGVRCHLFEIKPKKTSIVFNDERMHSDAQFTVNNGSNAYFEYFGRKQKTKNNKNTSIKPVQKENINEFIFKLIPRKTFIAQVDIYKNIKKHKYNVNQMQEALKVGERCNIFRMKTLYSSKANGLMAYWGRTGDISQLPSYLKTKKRKKKHNGSLHMPVLEGCLDMTKDNNITTGGGRKRSTEWNDFEARRLSSELRRLRYYRSRDGLDGVDRGALK